MPEDYTQIVKQGLFYNGEFVQGLWLEAANGNPYDHDLSTLSSRKQGFWLQSENAGDFKEIEIPQGPETLNVFLLARDRPTAEKYAVSYTEQGC